VQVKELRCLVRWKRVIIGAVLGGLLGFGGQLLKDYFYWVAIVDAKTPYQYITDGTLASKAAQVGPVYQWQKRAVMCEGIFLFWLVYRGDLAGRTALILAFIGASAALALDRQKSGKSTAKSKITANEVAEPKTQLSVSGPREEPAQIEMTEQATTMKATPKKEHVEA
jgi:hypothetical protein